LSRKGEAAPTQASKNIPDGTEALSGKRGVPNIPSKKTFMVELSVPLACLFPAGKARKLKRI